MQDGPDRSLPSQALAAAAANPYRRALRGLRPAFLAVAGFSALINLLMLTGPLYMLQVYDRVLSSGSLATLRGLFIIVAVLFAFLGLYEFLRSRLLARAATRLELAVGPQAFRAWLRAGGDRPGGEKAGGNGEGALPLRDLEMMRGFISGPAMGGIFDLPWIPLYLGLLFLIHPSLGWLTLGGAAVVALAAWANRRVTQGALDRSGRIEAEARLFADQSLRGAEAIEAMGMEARITDRWWRMRAAGLATGQQASDRSEVTGAFSKAFRLFLQSAMLTLGAFLVLQHEMSAGMIIATSILSGRALAPVDMMIAQWRSIGRASLAHRRLLAFFDTVRVVPAAVALPTPTGRISVARLTRYVPGGRPGVDSPRMLDRVSFDLAPGDGLGVIGASASGKTTLARLLVGAWRPDMGEIRFDGATRDQWDPEALGRAIGYLPQTVDLLAGTIRDNITRFDPEATDEAAIAAATMAGVHEMILALPQGYATRVGGAEQPLSGGQVQRLGLVRAIYGMPRIVVLDEPNSNLDTEGEAALAGAIRALRAAGSTVIVMTHRTSALAELNQVMLLNTGRIVRFGDRDTVLRSLMLRPVSADADTETGAVRAGEPPSPEVRSAAAQAMARGRPDAAGGAGFGAGIARGGRRAGAVARPEE